MHRIRAIILVTLIFAGYAVVDYISADVSMTSVAMLIDDRPATRF